jgi:hypothetical protein
MADIRTKVGTATQPVDTRAASKAPLFAEAPASQPNALLTPAPAPPAPEPSAAPAAVPQSNESLLQSAVTRRELVALGNKPFFQDFEAGEKDPLAGVKIEVVLKKTDDFIVYIDGELVLRWHWNATVDVNSAAPIFNRACELQAKSEFLRQALRKRALQSARQLIGEGLVVMLCTKNPVHASEALDTAEKFIDQAGRETSRGWYFGPFFIFFSLSVASGLVLFFNCQVQNTTLPLVCCLAGGIGAFISTAIGNQRIPCAPSAGLILHLLEALLRYTIGFAAGPPGLAGNGR